MGEPIPLRVAQQRQLQDGELQWINPADWGDREPPRLDWLVHGCFIAGTVALLAGDGGVGKSLIMQQLLTASSLGHDWLRLPTKRVPSIAIFAEDDADELERRQHAINRHYGCCNEDLVEHTCWLARPGQDNALMKFGRWGGAGERTRLYEKFRQRALDMHAQLIVLDTRKDVFQGNAIDEDQIRTFLATLRRLAIEIGGTVIITEHPSRSGISDGSGRNGSVQWGNSVRSRLYFVKNRDKTVELKTMKVNSGPPDGRVPLLWRDGVFQRVEKPATRDFTEPGFGQEWPG